MMKFSSSARVPQGLEAARALGQRGYHVILTDANREAGGRVDLESKLPNLTEWRRVIDWRLTQIQKIENIFFYPSSPMTAKDVLEAGAPHVILATGSHLAARRYRPQSSRVPSPAMQKFSPPTIS